jgi:hypothetical protein
MEGKFQATFDSRLQIMQHAARSKMAGSDTGNCNVTNRYHMFTSRGSEIRLQRMSLEDLEFSRTEV